MFCLGCFKFMFQVSSFMVKKLNFLLDKLKMQFLSAWVTKKRSGGMVRNQIPQSVGGTEFNHKRKFQKVVQIDSG